MTRTSQLKTWWCLFPILSLILSGCGGGSSSTSTEKQQAGVSISISPSSANVAQGALEGFTAVVTNTPNMAVTWKVQETGGGSITNSGLYTAPNTAGTFHVFATSQADTTKSAIATVTVNALAPSVAISITPTSATLNQGAAQEFTASVTGTTNIGVNWSVQEGSAGGSITNGGLYTAPNTAGTFHVIASSTADPARRTTAVITVNPITVMVNPSVTEILEGDSWAFTASVTGASSQGVQWKVLEGPSGGTITATGRYTAPAIITGGTFHVLAASMQDGITTGSATITVPAVAVYPDAATVYLTASAQLTATVSGTAHDTLAWGPVVEGSAGGSITSSGLYTAPNTPGIYHVMVTLVALPSLTSIAPVLVPDPSVSIAPSSAAVMVGTAQQFSANVTDVNAGVIWTVQSGGAGGTITPQGLYTAPATTGTDTVVATSVTYPSRSAQATVAVTAHGFRYTGSMDAVRDGGASATLLRNGAILVAGGSQTMYECAMEGCSYTTLPAPTAELYDPATGTFSSAGTIQVQQHAAILLQGGDVLIAGGTDPNCCTVLATAYLYDPTAQALSATGNLIARRCCTEMALLPDGTAFIAGGSDADGTSYSTPYLKSAERYDPNSATFSSAGDMSTPRIGHTATTLQDGRVLIVGGENLTAVLSSAEIYDPAAGAFSLTGSLITARTDHTATLLGDGRVLIAGGLTADGTRTASVEIYDPSKGTFTSAGTLLVARSDHSATLLGDGEVLITGGLNDTGPGPDGLFSFTCDYCELGAFALDSAELYNPASAMSVLTGSLREPRSAHRAILLPDGKTVLVIGGSQTNTAEIYK